MSAQKLLHYATALRRNEYIATQLLPSQARVLIEHYHYAGGVGNTSTLTFGLYRRNDPTATCLGALWFQPPPLGAAKRIAGNAHRRVLMLSRTVLVPWAPRNSATFLLGAALRHLRTLPDDDGSQRWWHVVTYADEYMAQQPVHLRVPGGIYRGSNWRCLGRSEPRWLYVERESGRLRSRYSAGHSYSQADMAARGCERIGPYGVWCFHYDLTLSPHEQTLRAHAARRALPAFLAQLPLVA